MSIPPAPPSPTPSLTCLSDDFLKALLAEQVHDAAEERILDENRNVPTNAPKTFKCRHPGCHKYFHLERRFTAHDRWHRLARVCPSPGCGLQLPNCRKLDLHTQVAHGYSYLTCDRSFADGSSAVCGRRFPSDAALARHKTSHDKGLARSFRCDWVRDGVHCTRAYAKKESLEEHIRTSHRPLCSHCRGLHGPV